MRLSRAIATANKVVLNIHVAPVKNMQTEEESFYTKSESSNYKGITYNCWTTFTLERRGEVYDKINIVKMNPVNFVMSKRVFREFLDDLYASKIFTRDKDDILGISSKDIREHSIILDTSTIKDNINRIFLCPTVITIDDGKGEKLAEGLAMCFNKNENVEYLTIKEFEYLVDTMEKVDPFMYSQAMISTYLGMQGGK